ncbi:MAG: enoyl-CoA hydratase-related protein, partial [Acidobacteria bacterium]|nr:enoyl-CoA hydratase-related protein [Acidobacteriota bacterium]
MTVLSEMVSLEERGEVALLVVDNPPVNALSHGVRIGLYEGMKRIAADDSIRAAVLWCRGRTFIAGADIREFGRPREDPQTNEIRSLMESSTKPMVAAIHGTALGGGLETAMACHYRVAVEDARLGLPEVKIGILPGGGGTQRLPRIVGVKKALEMITGGEPIGAREALDSGLIDEIVEGELSAAAVAFAQRAVAEGWPLKRVRDLADKVAEARAEPGIFDDHRRRIARKTRGFRAPENCIRAIEAAVSLPFEEGLRREQELSAELVNGEQAKAQRYYFFAERAAQKIPDLQKETPSRRIETAGVLGAGTMGGGIAMNFVNAG